MGTAKGGFKGCLDDYLDCAARDLQLELLQLLIGQFLVFDVGPDHLLIPTNGRDKVSAPRAAPQGDFMTSFL